MLAKPARLLRRAGLSLLGILLLVIVAFAVVPALRTPRHDRVWAPDNERLAAVHRTGSQVTISNVRDARYRATDDFDVRWTDRTVDIDALESVWVMVEPFREHPSIGHTILSFGFSDGQYLAVSSEVRREPGEEYGVWTGMLATFELMPLVADERDVFGLRANHRQDEVYLYPLRLRAEERERVLLATLNAIEKRRQIPAFYHTLTSNCTTTMVELLRAARPDLLPAWHWSYLLPSSFDRLLLARRLVETELDLEAARAKFRINARTGDGADTLPDFSARIRRAS
jgi:hypothetical protein